MTLKAPFPYFGGKSKVASEVWSRFGDVPNYVEPFCGSAAVLIGRPTTPRIETVNDANCFIANFWRAVQHDPEAAAHHANWPVNEADLHARHRWLMLSESSVEWRERMKTDPDFYDAKVAGWWVWGASCWIGAGWCDGGRLFGRDGGTSNKKPETRISRGDSAAIGKPADRRRPELSAGNGRGVTAATHEKRPAIANSGRGDASAGLHKNLPSRSTAGTGVNQPSIEQKRPRLTGWGEAGGHRQLPQQVPDLDRSGMAVHKPTLHKKIPELGSSRGDTSAKLGMQMPDASKSRRGDTTVTPILQWFVELSERLRRVRVVCGDWQRVMTPAVTSGIGTTAVFLDPPYGRLAGRTPGIYSEDDGLVADRVREWCVQHGDDPTLRIALCGYEGEHQLPSTWSRYEWTAQGGYANQRKSGDGYANRLRERVWFSPHCLTSQQGMLQYA